MTYPPTAGPTFSPAGDSFDASDIRSLLPWELAERREAGYDTVGLDDAIASAVSRGDTEECWRLLPELTKRPKRADWTYEEPEELSQILADGRGEPSPGEPLDSVVLADRLWAAWAGRAAGCMLGKPVEGWTREQLRSYLALAGAYPVTDYIPAMDPMPSGGYLFWPCWATTCRGRVTEVTRDDDIDYTIIGLIVLETYGRTFHAEDVGAVWVTNLPYLETFTAERVAYRNLVDGLRPPETATHLNPYREWIGAQIRADMWGYVNPGRPAAAAEMAYRDATLSHRANGVYGSMWVAALLAACFVSPSMRVAMDHSLACIPKQSRLAEALGVVLAQFDGGATWEEVRDQLEARFASHSWIHALNNAAVVAAALLWGEGDYTRTVGLAVQGAWDTDCNGATAGSAFGAMHGRGGLPDRWVAPLNNLVRSAVKGFDRVTFDELAARTAAQCVGCTNGQAQPAEVSPQRQEGRA